MRKIKAFSAQMTVTSVARRSSFSEHRPAPVATSAQGERDVYMTPSLIRQTIREMKRPVNIRFLQLIKSSKQFARGIKDPNDLMYLKRFIVTQLTELLGEYVNMLQVNSGLQLTNYLKLQSVVPDAYKEGKVLSRVMINANKIRRNSGVLPPKNQRDLNKAMNDFIQAIVDSNNTGINVNNPLLNEQLQS